MTEEAQPRKLNKAQEVFISEYIQCFNATEAYSRAYPKAKRTTAGTNGHELLKNTEIAARIQARLAEVHMSADEALKLTADIARGDIAQLMDITSMGGVVDLKTAQERGLTKLIKKIKQKTTIRNAKTAEGEDSETHEIELELYDAQAALRDILKVNEKLSDTTQVKVIVEYAERSKANPS